MGMNFSSCCHKCMESIFHFRGEESKSLHAFYKRHYQCMRENPFNIETLEDQVQEAIWMRSADNYKSVTDLLKELGAKEFIETGNPYK